MGWYSWMLRGRLVNGIPKKESSNWPSIMLSPRLRSPQPRRHQNGKLPIVLTNNWSLKWQQWTHQEFSVFMVHFMPKRRRRARAHISIRKKFFDPQRPSRWRRVHEVQFIANRAVSFNLFFVQPTLHVFSMCCYGQPRLLRDSSHLAFLIFMPRNDNNWLVPIAIFSSSRAIEWNASENNVFMLEESLLYPLIWHGQ